MVRQSVIVSFPIAKQTEIIMATEATGEEGDKYK